MGKKVGQIIYLGIKGILHHNHITMESLRGGWEAALAQPQSHVAAFNDTDTLQHRYTLNVVQMPTIIFLCHRKSEVFCGGII